VEVTVVDEGTVAGGVTAEVGTGEDKTAGTSMVCVLLHPLICPQKPLIQKVQDQQRNLHCLNLEIYLVARLKIIQIRDVKATGIYAIS